MMRAMQLADRGHAGMADRYRLGALVDGGDALETPDGVLYAFRTDFAVMMNGAIVASGGDPVRLLAAAREFFGERRRGFTFYARTATEDDAARAAGLQVGKDRMPAMALRAPVPQPEAQDGVVLRRIATDEEARDYLRVVEAAFTATGMPPGILVDFRPATVTGDDTAGFVAYADGEPVAAASVVLARGIGGIQWVGVVETARRRGLAVLVTAAAANAGFAMGADCAWLEASTMGEPVYARMGFEEVFSYRVWTALVEA
jgi:ribosomal protein S18 acetylase RimI-like enzyme